MTAIEIVEPGIYEVPEEEYHADCVKGGSLSCSGARVVLDCPAKFAWEQEHGEPYRAVWDFGHAAHFRVLGAGAEIDVLEFDDWRTKAAKEARDEARLYGRTAVLAKDWEIVEAMAAEIRRHPIASKLFVPGDGLPEQSLFWRDEQTGIMLRSRVDWLPAAKPGRRMTVVDYKTARSADPVDLGRACVDYGYHQQDAWYREGVAHLLDVEDPAFVFVVQEKTPPYVVSVVELDDDAKRVGSERNRRAIDLYASCMKSGVWPAYTSQIVPVSLPFWAVRAHDDAFDRNPDDESQF